MFGAPWHFVIAGKSIDAKANWLADEATINLRLRKRARATIDGGLPFLHFDGATMVQYQYPPKSAEVVYCRRDPMPEGCELGHGFPHERSNLLTNEALEVKKPRLGDDGSLSLVASQSLPQDSYVGLESLIHNVEFSHPTHKMIQQLKNHWSYAYAGNTIDAYINGCGYPAGRHVSCYVAHIHWLIQSLCLSPSHPLCFAIVGGIWSFCVGFNPQFH